MIKIKKIAFLLCITLITILIPGHYATAIEKTNQKPIISIVNSIYRRGIYHFDAKCLQLNPNYIKDSIIANDLEDGDLKSKINIIDESTKFDDNYIHYNVTVSDKDNNVVSENFTINIVYHVRPSIYGSDKLIVKGGSNYDLMEGLTAIDEIDGDLTKCITIDNPIPTEPGTYILMYSVTNSIGYCTSFHRTVTILSNEKPVINAKDFNVPIGIDFNPLKDITATDCEDGDLTSNIIITGDYDINKLGDYTLIYSVTDSDNNTTLKEVNLKVRTNEIPVINAQDIIIYEGESYNPLEWVTAFDKEDGDLTSRLFYSIYENEQGETEIYYDVYDNDFNFGYRIVSLKIIPLKDECKIKTNYFGCYSNKLTGWSEPGATVKAYYSGELIGESQVEIWGGFEMPVDYQKVGNKLTLEVSKKGYKTSTKDILVTW